MIHLRQDLLFIPICGLKLWWCVCFFLRDRYCYSVMEILPLEVRIAYTMGVDRTNTYAFYLHTRLYKTKFKFGRCHQKYQIVLTSALTWKTRTKTVKFPSLLLLHEHWTLFNISQLAIFFFEGGKNKLIFNPHPHIHSLSYFCIWKWNGSYSCTIMYFNKCFQFQKIKRSSLFSSPTVGPDCVSIIRLNLICHGEKEKKRFKTNLCCARKKNKHQTFFAICSGCRFFCQQFSI